MDNQIDTRSLFAPKKGKEATKGQKQIYHSNKETISFYSKFALIPILVRLLIFLVFAPTKMEVLMSVFAIVVQLVSVGGMYHMSKPVLTGPSNTVIDGGIDLNMKGGFADHIKDVIITTAICTCLSAFSNWFWVLWLLVPAYFSYKIWVGMIAPWIFAPPPDEPAPELADKKRKKMERKMARAGYR